MLTFIMIVSIIIIIVIIAAAAITTSKAYAFKHTIDPIENNPNIRTEMDEKNNTHERSDT
ncbi:MULTISPECIES: YtzI protein [Heyndrickxia]|uniref:YtzI protein n=2 Tax=Heyndrickxia oleronia TaxID=38875 RepID=A0AAW6T3C1_9BACI|nr:YtzI protein [Heyndrickxia oleronia]OJH17316.1 hypothetical protein BLX88_17815 [Bacillus obstructivus]MCI1592180.1 YtzI protein [Heyndrickxia oleronia]MCI1612710.1 YtzI protein [Heyndrickxia oleronia]MCI1744032.1 YtzI protein [Heyndrickxia oleronia]MCI1760746.1 YtzI protein [Heyndrickxia oleronia]